MTAADIRAERLTRWDRRIVWWLVAAAFLPMTDLGRNSGEVGVLVGFGTWGVFLVDLLVRVRLSPGYLRRPAGWFDLGVVVLTFPWWIFDVFGGSQYLQLIRWARLARVAFYLGPVRRVLNRIAGPGLVALGAVLIAAAVVRRVEPPSSGFSSYWESLWWAVVTLTTVGYGDLVPNTVPGRVAAILLMVAGIGILGVLAGSLAEAFGLQDQPSEEPVDLPTASEIAALRAEVAELSAKLDRGGTDG